MEWKITRYNEEFEAFNKLSSKEKRLYYFIDDKILPSQRYVSLYNKGDNIVLAVKTTQWYFINNRFFTKSIFRVLATITPKRIYSDCIQHAGNALCEYFGFTCTCKMNKILFRKILKHGKEAYDKYVESISEQNYPNIKDVKIFVEGDVSTFRKRYSDNIELQDLYRQAIILDRKIKTMWSDRKIHDIHMKWSEEIDKLKHRNLSTEPIWDINIQLPEDVELLNSEMRIAEEGSKMHHCIFNVYCSQLKYKSCVAFHVRNFTVMYSITPSVEFNQAFYAWNKSLSKEDMEYAKSLINYVKVIAESEINKIKQFYKNNLLCENLFQ